MNTHSGGLCQAQDAILQSFPEIRVSRLGHLAVDRAHDVVAAQGTAHGVDVQMKMGCLNPELEQDGAIGTRDVEEHAFDDSLNSGKLLCLRVGQVGEVLDVTGGDEHRVTADRGVGMKQKLPVTEVDDELAG